MNRAEDNKENIPELQNQGGSVHGNIDPHRLSKDITHNIKKELSEDGSYSERSDSEEDLEIMYSTELQLYADHEVKPDMVIGPVVLQRPVIKDWDYPNKQGSIKEENSSSTTQINSIKSELQLKHGLESFDENHDYNEENNDTEEVNPIPRVQSPNDVKGPKTKRNSKPRKNLKPSKSEKYTIPKNNYTLRKRKGKCPHCKKYFTSLESHLLTHETSFTKTRKACDETVDETFDNKHGNKWHKSIEKHRYICDYCKKSVRSRDSLIVHLENHTTNSKKVRRLEVSLFPCNFCEKSFTYKCNLSRHIETKHGKGETYSCQFCSKTFTRKQYLQEHENRVHHPKISKEKRKQFECSMCDKIYYDASNRNRHFRVQHLGKSYSKSNHKIKKVICDYCMQTFDRKKKLIFHIMQNHMGNKFNNINRCKLCKKQYTRSFNLKFHMRKHRGEKKPYMCQLCGKSYSRRWYLPIHIKKSCSQNSKPTLGSSQ